MKPAAGYRPLAYSSPEAVQTTGTVVVVDEVERAKNRTKSKVRARVEHAIGVIKRVFGFAKVRYRGLKKNTHRLLVTCALANLFMVRRHLLRCQAA
jgi:IS5 family transposase